MPRMPGVPFDQGQCPQGSLRPVGVVAHRTYGSWNGDYGVGLGSRCPVGFHFLVGPEPGQWVQFYDTTTRCAHAGTNANGNDISVGIEVSGTNDDPMTPWQLDRVRDIVNWLYDMHGIERTYRFSTAHNLVANSGYIPHSAVKGADHSDYWTVEDWQKIIQEDDMSAADVWAYPFSDYTGENKTTTAAATLAQARYDADRAVILGQANEAQLALVLERLDQLETGSSGGGSHTHEVGPPVTT